MLRIIFLLIIFSLILIPIFAKSEKKAHKLKLENCEQCHTTEGWNKLKKDVVFDHSKTGFELKGKHSVLNCSDCHTFDKVIIGYSCSNCHKDVHKGKLGNNCQNCHNQESFKSNRNIFDHNQTAFPLNGAHKMIPCTSCHKSSYENKYKAVPTNCYYCHKKDYDKTKSPNHITFNFNKDCEHCHDAYSWTNGRYREHEAYFPINSGDHAGYSCSTCHTDKTNYTVFSCFKGCHDHSKSKTDRKHNGVSGYVYDSIACYSCHPRGKK